jgi:hypothetical protein
MIGGIWGMKWRDMFDIGAIWICKWRDLEINDYEDS